MRYYCKTCKSEFIPGNDKLKMPPVDKPEVYCPFCDKKHQEFGIVPEWETPEQYEQRTGKILSWEAAVWYRGDINEWRLECYGYAAGIEDVEILVGQSPEQPPEDWE